MSETKIPSVFETLAKIDCSKHTETINAPGRRPLTYLSWAWAWHICKEHYPAAFYTIYETPEGRPYFDDGRTAWVKTGVTIEGLEHIEYLPIMDARHNSIPVDKITSFDMNTAIQRSLTKAVARHGLGLYIYAGEDLPYFADEEKPAPRKATKAAPKAAPAPTPAPAPAPAPRKVEEKEYAGGLTERQYLSLVKLAAKNEKTKTGQDPRDAFIANCHPTPEEIDAFDDAVFDYVTSNNL